MTGERVGIMSSGAMIEGGVRPAPGMAMVTGVDCRAFVFQRGYRTVSGRSHAPDYDATVDAYLAWLDGCGLSHGVLVQPAFYGLDNACLIDALSRAPYRLRGVAALSPDVPEHELWTLDALGVRGARLPLQGLRLDVEPWPRFLRLLARMGWHVELSGRADGIESVASLILRHGVDLVLDDGAVPEPAAGIADPRRRALLRLGRTGRVWARLSAGRDAAGRAVLHGHAAMREALGPERLLWGGDWPHVRFDAPQGGAAGAFLSALVSDPGERQALFSGNPSLLYRID